MATNNKANWWKKRVMAQQAKAVVDRLVEGESERREKRKNMREIEKRERERK